MPFERLITEIRFSFWIVALFYTTIRTSIVFLISFLIIMTFNINWWIAFLPALIYFARDFRKRTRTNPFREIEKRYPKLEDSLRAAKDNLDEGNIFIFDLHKDVIQNIKDVEIAQFFDPKKGRNDLLVLVVLAIIIIAVAPLNVTPLSFSFKGGKFDLSMDSLKDLFSGGLGEGDFGGDEGGSGKNEDIFGKKSVASLGDENIEIQISSTNSEIDINDVRDAEKKEFKSTYPEEIGAIAASTFDENIPKEQQELVKNYYKKIAEG